MHPLIYPALASPLSGSARTASLSPSGGEGIETAPSPSPRERVPPNLIRGIVITAGTILTVIYAWRY